MLNKISKPHIVDLLRISDRRRWLSPRIRYASVRSKPELIADIRRHFTVVTEGKRLRFFPISARGLPEIEYDLEKRKYYLDGHETDVPRISRVKPSFVIRYFPVTLTF